MQVATKFIMSYRSIGAVAVLLFWGLAGCGSQPPTYTWPTPQPTVVLPTPPPRPTSAVDLADARARLEAGGTLTYPEVITLHRALVGYPADLPTSGEPTKYSTALAALETRESTFTAQLEKCRLTDTVGWIAYWQPEDRSSTPDPQRPMRVYVYMYDPYAPSEGQNNDYPELYILGWTQAQTAALHAGEQIRFSGDWTLWERQEAVRAVRYEAVIEATKLPPPTLADAQDLRIELSRSVCFGACPDYTVTITGDGRVTFDGQDYTRVKGTATTQIGASEIQALLAEIQKVGFFELADAYDANVTDNPTYSVAVQWQGRIKRVQDYVAGPRKLRILEDRIDQIVNSDQWIK